MEQETQNMEHITYNTKHNTESRQQKADSRDKDEEIKNGQENVQEKEVDECEEKYKKLEHKYKRALADYQNLLKRTAVEKEEFARYANEQLLHEIIPVYDNLKMSLAHADIEAERNGWLEGIKYVIKQFGEVLKNMGVREIKTAGEKFDHNAMEAVEKKETDDEAKEGIVAAEIMPGYKLHGKVIRPARVAVYKVKHE